MSQTINIVEPESEVVDEAFCHWLAGFTDGEGSFNIQKNGRGARFCTFKLTEWQAYRYFGRVTSNWAAIDRLRNELCKGRSQRGVPIWL